MSKSITHTHTKKDQPKKTEETAEPEKTSGQQSKNDLNSNTQQ